MANAPTSTRAHEFAAKRTDGDGGGGGGDNDNVHNLMLLSPQQRLYLMKRSREEDDDGEHASKVRRVSKVDRLSRLSDELLVRILSFVPVASLLTCQRYAHSACARVSC